MLVQDIPATDALARLRAEYLDMPGLKLTKPQVQRLFHLDGATCEALVSQLLAVGFLRRTDDGLFIRFELASSPEEPAKARRSLSRADFKRGVSPDKNRHPLAHTR